MSTVYHDLQQRLQAAEKGGQDEAAGGGENVIAEMSPSSLVGFEEYFKTYPMNNK